jgi:hypothetical protein
MLHARFSRMQAKIEAGSVSTLTHLGRNRNVSTEFSGGRANSGKPAPLASAVRRLPGQPPKNDNAATAGAKARKAKFEDGPIANVP